MFVICTTVSPSTGHKRAPSCADQQISSTISSLKLLDGESQSYVRLEG